MNIFPNIDSTLLRNCCRLLLVFLFLQIDAPAHGQALAILDSTTDAWVENMFFDLPENAKVPLVDDGYGVVFRDLNNDRLADIYVVCFRDLNRLF